MALVANPLTPSLKALFQGFGQYNPMFNIPSQFLNYPDEKPYNEAYEYGF